MNLKIDSVVLYGSRVVPAAFLFTVILIWCLCLWMIYRFCFNKIDISLLKDRIGEYKYYRLLLIVFIALTVMIVYGALVFSGKQYVYYDIGGGDEPEAYIPLYFYYIKKIAAGEISPWTFNNGLGTSTLSVSGYIFNPFILIVYIVGVLFGVSTINDMLLVVQIINILVCGLLCYKYLSNFKISPYANFIASYIFAFNGFLILFCQHYIFMQFPLYTLLMLIVIENMIKSEHVNKFHFIFSVVCMLIFCCSVYMGYMIGLFSGIYAIVRLIMIHQKSQIKLAMKKVFMALGFAILGILLAMPLMLPMAGELLFNSNRITGNNVGIFEKIINFLLTPYPIQAVKTIFLRLLSNNFQGAGNDFTGATGNSISDYYAPPTLFFSVFFFMFVCIYFETLRKRCKSIKDIIIQIAIGVMVIFLMFNRLGSAIFNGFVDIFGRYSFILMPIFAVMVGVAIDQMMELKNKNRSVVYSLLITAAILIRQFCIAISRPQIKYLSIILLIGIILLILMLVMNGVLQKGSNSFIRIGILTLIFINVVSESYVTVNKRAFCLFSAELLDEDDVYTQEALEFIKNEDASMYRTEKNYYDLIYFHDAYFQNYRGISTYNATLNKNIKEFYREYCNTGINFYGFDSFWYSFMNVSNDIIQNSLLGIRYILSDGAEYPESLYEKVYQNNKTLVYKNKATDSFGIFYDYAIPRKALEGKDMITKTSILQKAIIVEDDYIDANVVGLDSNEIIRHLNEREHFCLKDEYSILTGKSTTYDINENQICINSDGESEIEIIFESEVTVKNENSFLEFYTNIGYDDSLRIYFDCGKGYQVLKEYYLRGNVYGELQGTKILLPTGLKSIKISASCPSYVIEDLKIVSSDQPIVPNDVTIHTELVKDNIVSGSLANDRSGYLFLPIPYENGWSAYVDGNEVEMIQADLGFMAIKLDAGKHNFELKYQYPYINLGIIISLLGVFMLLGVYIKFLLKKNCRKQVA